MKKNWSDLNATEKSYYLTKARQIIYIGLEPTSAEKEAQIAPKARELYYQDN